MLKHGDTVYVQVNDNGVTYTRTGNANSSVVNEALEEGLVVATPKQDKNPYYPYNVSISDITAGTVLRIIHRGIVSRNQFVVTAVDKVDDTQDYFVVFGIIKSEYGSYTGYFTSFDLGVTPNSDGRWYEHGLAIIDNFDNVIKFHNFWVTEHNTD